MSTKRVVHVVGTGTLGEPLISLLLNLQRDLEFDELTFHKHRPLLEDRVKILTLIRRGAKLAVEADKVAEFEKLGLRPTYTRPEGVSELWIWYPLLRTGAISFVGGAMITQVLHCPYCHGTDIVRHGLSPEGKQRYQCRACLEGRGRTFLLDYSYAGQSPAVKQQIVDMAMNASGIRDTACVLHVSPTTVLKELKKRNLKSSK